jgi:hypothetical protein
MTSNDYAVDPSWKPVNRMQPTNVPQTWRPVRPGPPPTPGQPGPNQPPTPDSPHGRPERPRDSRQKGDARVEFRKEIVAWRPVVIWVGAVSATTEIGLGMPPVGGAVLRGVGLRLRATHAPDEDNYWTVGVYIRDKDGNATLVPDSEETTVSQEFPAHINFNPYRASSGVRIQPFAEPTVKITKKGSPAALSGVQLQGDWFVGI